MLQLVTTPSTPAMGCAANEPEFVRRRHHLFAVNYRKRNGDTGCINLISTTRAGAMLRAIEVLDCELRMLDARVLS